MWFFLCEFFKVCNKILITKSHFLGFNKSLTCLFLPLSFASPYLESLLPKKYKFVKVPSLPVEGLLWPGGFKWWHRDVSIPAQDGSAFSNPQCTLFVKVSEGNSKGEFQQMNFVYEGRKTSTWTSSCLLYRSGLGVPWVHIFGRCDRNGYVWVCVELFSQHPSIFYSM